MVGNVLIILVGVFGTLSVLTAEKFLAFRKEKELFKADIAYKMSCFSSFVVVMCFILYLGFGEGV